MKKIIPIVAAILVIVLPLGILLGMLFLVPPQYSNVFVGALDEKFERLTSIDEDKIIVVGGSSVAFGLDSELMEKYTGMPVVNFGLYAALGTKVMLDLSRPGIKEGDIVTHMTFGRGEVLSVKPMGADTLYEVAFDKVGTKKLMGTYARLKKG